jgi:hypothetical protein
MLAYAGRTKRKSPRDLLAEVDRELCDMEGGALWAIIIPPAASSSRKKKTRRRKSKNTKGKHPIMGTLTATDYEVPGPGQHRVEIQEVKLRDGKFGDYYRIATKIVGGEFDGLWVSFVASAKLSPAAKLRIAIEDILDRRLKKGEEFDPQTLVGKEAIAEVETTTKDECTFANITQFFPLPQEHNGSLREAQKAASKAGDVEITEEDFEDIPF